MQALQQKSGQVEESWLRFEWNQVHRCCQVDAGLHCPNWEYRGMGIVFSVSTSILASWLQVWPDPRRMQPCSAELQRAAHCAALTPHHHTTCCTRSFQTKETRGQISSAAVKQAAACCCVIIAPGWRDRGGGGTWGAEGACWGAVGGAGGAGEGGGVGSFLAPLFEALRVGQGGRGRLRLGILLLLRLLVLALVLVLVLVLQHGWPRSAWVQIELEAA